MNFNRKKRVIRKGSPGSRFSRPGALQALKRANQKLHQQLRKQARAIQTLRGQKGLLSGHVKDWKNTFDAMPDAVWLLSPDRRILRCNKATKRLFGKSPKEVIGRRCCEIVHGTEIPPLECSMRRMRRTRRMEHSVIRVGKRWLSVTADPVINKAGALVSAVHIVSDITVKKEAEQALLESEKKYRSLFEASKDAMMTLEPPFWRFSSANHAMVRMFKPKGREELLRYSPWRLSPPKQPDGTSSARKAHRMIQAAMRQGSHFFEWVHRRLDGTTFPTEVLLTRVDREGKTFLQATVRDIADRKQAEAELNRREAYLSAIIENQPGITWLKDKKGRFLAVNRLFAKACGLRTPASLVGKTDLDIWPKKLARKYRADDRQVMKNRKSLSVEELVAIGGVQKWHETFKTAVLDNTGRVIGTSGCGQDITERKAIERELKETKERLEYILGATNTGVDVIDKDFNICYVDPAWEKKYGSYKGEKCYRYFMGRDTVCPGCGIPQAFKTHKKIVTEEVLVHENNRVVEVHTIPFKSNTGEWLVAEFNVDITQRKRIQEALDENRRQLREIIDTVPHMIFAQDRQGRFLLANRAMGLAYGKKPEELIGVRRKDIHPVAEEAEDFLKDNNEVWASGKPALRAGEFFTDIQGRKHILESIKIPFKMAGTEKKAILGVSVDMTEQKKVEDFRNDVVRTISHELRTPLSIEKGAITLVLDGLAGGPVNAKQRELLVMVLHNIERLSRLIDNLLDVSRIESGKLKIYPKEEDLVRIVRDAVFENKKRALDKNLQLKMRLPEQAAVIYADRDKIFQVVSNLIDNALKFTEQGVIELSVKVFEKEVECSVQDTGSGMTQQNMEKVFKKFHQFSRIPGAGEKGLGLGLAICKGFVEAHGGKIWLQSHSGRGTRVTFVLPRRRSKKILSEKGA